ncbi:MAG TPA: hypothetical protein VLA66_00465 [Thermoanaerobaculia bacterium]|nr:hypothetical protein [Thermoanaerobaculia bacterium]
MASTGIPRAAGRLAAAAVVASLALSTASGQAAPRTHRLSGRIELVEKGRPATDRSLDRTHAVVWYEPSAGASAPEPARVEMSTYRKQFSPQVVVVPVGSTVRFPNLDPILHNVFSVSGKNSFDLGLVGRGEGKEAVFHEAGIVRVFCNVHHGMFAHVVVVPSSHYAVPDAQGRFVLEGVPEGVGTLRYWQERGEPGSQRTRVPAAGEVTLAIPVTQPRVPPHRNKFGRSYSGGAYGG